MKAFEEKTKTNGGQMPTKWITATFHVASHLNESLREVGSGSNEWIT